jgi:hypothetical protein
MRVDRDDVPNHAVDVGGQRQERDAKLSMIVRIDPHITAIHLRAGGIDDPNGTECWLDRFAKPHLKLHRHCRGRDYTPDSGIGALEPSMSHHVTGDRR